MTLKLNDSITISSAFGVFELPAINRSIRELTEFKE